MAVKTFAVGEVLTASDTNTYLNNGGLVYITSFALSGSAVSVTNVFSATYDAYKFVFTNIQFGAAALLTAQMLNGSTPVTTATYNYTRFGYNGALVTTNTTGATSMQVGLFDTTVSGGSFEIYNPYLAKLTAVVGQSVYNANSAYAYPDFCTANNSNATSYDGIKLIPASTTFTSGTCRVYGFRQA